MLCTHDSAVGQLVWTASSCDDMRVWWSYNMLFCLKRQQEDGSSDVIEAT